MVKSNPSIGTKIKLAEEVCHTTATTPDTENLQGIEAEAIISRDKTLQISVHKPNSIFMQNS